MRRLLRVRDGCLLGSAPGMADRLGNEILGCARMTCEQAGVTIDMDEAQAVALLAKADKVALVYHEVEPVRRAGPIVTMAGLALGLLGGIVLGYMLHMAVHGV